MKEFECPKDNYRTKNAVQFINHLLDCHKNEASKIFMDLVNAGKIKIVVPK